MKPPSGIFTIKPLTWAMFRMGCSFYASGRLGVFGGKPVAFFR